MDNVLKDILKDICNIYSGINDLRHNVFVSDGCDIVRKLNSNINDRLVNIMYTFLEINSLIIRNKSSDELYKLRIDYLIKEISRCNSVIDYISNLT